MKHNQAFCYEVRVFAEDVDYMGIVYHANHLRYLERARTELLRQDGLILSDLEKEDTLFAISEVNIRYIAPARLDDLLTVVTQMQKSGACSFVFEQMIHNQQQRTICTAQIKVVCVNKHLKPKRFPGK